MSGEHVQQERKISSMGDVIDMTGDLMSEVYNDGKLTAAEKIKSFGQGQRIICGTRAEMRKTAMDLSRIGMKIAGNMNQLSFDALVED